MSCLAYCSMLQNVRLVHFILFALSICEFIDKFLLLKIQVIVYLKFYFKTIALYIF